MSRTRIGRHVVRWKWVVDGDRLIVKGLRAHEKPVTGGLGAADAAGLHVMVLGTLGAGVYALATPIRHRRRRGSQVPINARDWAPLDGSPSPSSGRPRDRRLGDA